ncbi:alpha/beta hydrolase [Achromobacter aloeverae]
MLHGTPYKTPAEVDLQFDLINHLWDGLPYYEFIVRNSELARQRFNMIADVRVGARDEERLDIFSSDKPDAPILIFVHGGWWRGGTRKGWSYLAFSFLKLGYTVVISDYTLCPKATVPDITQASRAAVAWSYENAEKINGDRNRIFLVGHSAGGQQAGMMAVTDWKQYGLPQDVLKGVVPMSGIFDMREFQSCFLQPYLQLTGDTAYTESPLFHIPETAPPILVMLGDEESVGFHRQSETFAKAWKDKGHRAEYYAVPGEDHATQVYMLGDADSLACQAIDRFLKSC